MEDAVDPTTRAPSPPASLPPLRKSPESLGLSPVKRRKFLGYLGGAQRCDGVSGDSGTPHLIRPEETAKLEQFSRIRKEVVHASDVPAAQARAVVREVRGIGNRLEAVAEAD
jgi:hypothetical protein